MQPTAPVTVRPKPRLPHRGPLTVMGPWAPVAGGLLGLVLGIVAALFLAGAVENFEDRLALVFMVLGLGMLGTSGVLLADEVRMIRQQAREAAVRPQWVETTAGLVNGLTPARLLLAASAWCSSWRRTSVAAEPRRAGVRVPRCLHEQRRRRRGERLGDQRDDPGGPPLDRRPPR